MRFWLSSEWQRRDCFIIRKDKYEQTRLLRSSQQQRFWIQFRMTKHTTLCHSGTYIFNGTKWNIKIMYPESPITGGFKVRWEIWDSESSSEWQWWDGIASYLAMTIVRHCEELFFGRFWKDFSKNDRKNNDVAILMLLHIRSQWRNFLLAIPIYSKL